MFPLRVVKKPRAAWNTTQKNVFVCLVIAARTCALVFVLCGCVLLRLKALRFNAAAAATVTVAVCGIPRARVVRGRRGKGGGWWLGEMATHTQTQTTTTAMATTMRTNAVTAANDVTATARLRHPLSPGTHNTLQQWVLCFGKRNKTGAHRIRGETLACFA